MAIAFDQIPNTLRVPGARTEFNNAGANKGATLKAYRALIIGQALVSGTAELGVPVQCSRHEQAVVLGGVGSLLTVGTKSWFENLGDNIETWLLPLADDADAVAATATVKLTGQVLNSGVLSLYVGGELVRVAASLNDSAAQVATKLAAAINVQTVLTVSAEAAAEVVTLTAKNKGAVANELDIRLNYYANEEKTPDGLKVEIVGFTGGLANPTLDAALASLGDKQFDVIVSPYTDGASMTALEAELEDRWGPMRHIDGLFFVGKAGGYAELSTFGNSRNSQFACVGGLPRVPNHPFSLAAATAGQAAFAAQNDPARPFQTLKLIGIKSPADVDLLTEQERNILLFNGISTYKVGAGGAVQIEMLITTYKLGAFGQPDASYLMINTPWTLSYLRYDWDAYIQNKYPRHKVADDGNKFGDGQPILTPKGLKAEAVSRAALWLKLGLVENLDQFTADTFAERNLSNPNRLDIMMVPDLVNQLTVIGNQIKFIV